ncbi:MAG: ABC transporter permease [Gemmatimonadaceae bacterium]|jgi:peptide/nickel transport system permease protein|nr:ABC transporter permease [Gemmatimonadaceae bacterium]
MRAALAVWLVLAVVLVGADWLAPHDPRQILDAEHLRSVSPSWRHPLGTDPSARDVLSRLLVGTRASLFLAIGAVSLATAIGVGIGTCAAAVGGMVDRVLMRVTDIGLALPRVLVLLTLVALWNVRSLSALVVAVGATGWMATSRLVREELRARLAEERVLAARAVGVPLARVMTRHLLPAIGPLLLVTMTGALAQVLLLEAGLSVIGLGVQPPDASWGTVLHDVSEVVGRARWLALGPGAVIVITVLATQRIGDLVHHALVTPSTPVLPIAS